MDPLRLKTIDRVLWPVALPLAKFASLLFRFRGAEPRPLILRPGGMGDLILLCIAVEELGYDPRDFFWIIERRSSVWARHLGLDYQCYDDGLITQNWKIAGRFSTIINSEQLFGLSQATAVLARGTGAVTTCFQTNRAASWAGNSISYDPDRAHEVVEFQRLLAKALGVRQDVGHAAPQRRRMVRVAGKPIVGIAGLQSPSRAFTEEAWVRLVKAWIGRGAFCIASSADDRPMAERLMAHFHRQAELFEGSFGELCDLISKSEEVFTVDGGFLHLASYYGVPVTGLFTSGRESKWAALAPGSRVVRRDDLSCQPCTRFGQVAQCDRHYACKELDFEQHASPAQQLPAYIGVAPAERRDCSKDASPAMLVKLG